ncbi:hypothetical protein QVD17_18799 [Tagetes erecta]|uniref:Leucine-rich repeat extensin-like protein 3 n=1 Tax=Tagetes erecta TaxID=13708 RepID=A0AAD8NWN7_TARER|nr:hypothetical protein QVD17_18799 [Tagetes erecta]
MEQLQNTLVFCFLLVFILHEVTPSPTPDANVLCISECGTCPLICSPPPSPSSVSKPPPSMESKPPPSSTPSHSEPPPYLTPIYHPVPPQSYSQPPPRSHSKSCPPPSYIEMGTNAPPPPPPPPKLVVVPSTQIQPSY